MRAFGLTSYERTHIALLAMALCATGARADEFDRPIFSFSGFGTLGVVHSSENNADFTSSAFKPNGAGYSRSWSAEVDSLIAAQVTANPTPRLSAVLQVISEQNYDATYRPHVEWANIKYQFTPDSSARLGRTVLPIFMVTDSRKVGYANKWVRPPVEVYSLVPVTSNDGVDASYRMPVGAATNTFQVTAGRSDSRFPDSGGFGTVTAKARGLAAFVDTFEQGFATVRLSAGRARITIPEFAPLFGAFRQFGPAGMAIADKYDVNKSLITFLGLGASYDPGNWFVMGEWSRIESRTILGKKSAWYVSSGRRFGRFMPYVTYARANADTLSDPGLTVSALPPVLAGPAIGLNATLNSILSRNIDQETISVGGRWDLMRNVSFSLQFDRTRIGTGSKGALSNIQPGFQPGGKVNLFSVAIDFVFR